MRCVTTVFPRKKSDLLEWKGSSKRDVIRFFVERQFGSNQRSLEERTDRTFTDFRQMLREEYQTSGVVPIKGAEITFCWLLDRSICVETTTGFDRQTNDLLLRTAGWQQIFSNSVCSSDVALGRPAWFMIFHAMEAANVTEVSEVINIGDIPLDLQAGARGVMGVLMGAHTVPQS